MGLSPLNDIFQILTGAIYRFLESWMMVMEVMPGLI